MRNNSGMTVRLSIGDMSRMTHLSVKALRHYHDIGLLVPAEVDRWSSYRYYQPEQVATAQVVRRFRDLGMPLEEIRAVMDAPDVAARNEVIVTYLDRMYAQLAQTQETVDSLRSLLDPEPTRAPVPVEYRNVPAVPAVAVSERVTVESALDWWMGAFDDLYRTVAALGATPAGPGGALFPSSYYEVEEAEVTAYVPLSALPSVTEPGATRVQPFLVPAAELAVALHAGPFDDIDRTYGQLGLHVAGAALGVDGPIREHYLRTGRDTPDQSQHRIEVAWPVFLTAVGPT